MELEVNKATVGFAGNLNVFCKDNPAILYKGKNPSELEPGYKKIQILHFPECLGNVDLILNNFLTSHVWAIYFNMIKTYLFLYICGEFHLQLCHVKCNLNSHKSFSENLFCLDIVTCWKQCLLEKSSHSQRLYSKSCTWGFLCSL